ncbi:hypothetical protein ACF0H5_015399 [Mactra antiquata]
MSTSLDTVVIRPPPPAYSEAIHYPVECISSPAFATLTKPALLLATKNSISILCHDQSVVKDLNNDNVIDTNLYETIPGDCGSFGTVTGHIYNNVNLGPNRKLRYKYNIKHTSFGGKPLILLEAIPETLASSQESMGVKTYARLEVIEPGTDHVEGSSMGGIAHLNGCDDRNLSRRGDIHPNGKAVLVPVNGIVTNDRMIVESSLGDVGDTSVEDWKQDSKKSSNTSLASDRSIETSVTIDGDEQVKKDLENLNQALEQEAKCAQIGENTPLLNEANAQSDTNDKKKDITHSKTSKTHRKCAGDVEYTDSGYSDSNRTELKEHVTDLSVDHVIYSEPECSSSDVSIKCFGKSPNRALDKNQRTLKRTNNGTDHTVYELSPSDSFYNSTDNMQSAEKRQSMIASDEEISRLGRSNSSFSEGQRSRQPLDTEASASIAKPMVVSADDDKSSSRSSELPPVVPQLEMDPDSISNPNSNKLEGSETIPSQLILEDTRTYYRRKAADRGTLYCAAGGITVVATIVFLLIYFS